MNKKNFHVVMSKYAKKLYAIEILLQKKLLEVCFFCCPVYFLDCLKNLYLLIFYFVDLPKLSLQTLTDINLFNI